MSDALELGAGITKQGATVARFGLRRVMLLFLLVVVGGMRRTVFRG